MSMSISGFGVYVLSGESVVVVVGNYKFVVGLMRKVVFLVCIKLFYYFC